MNWRLTKSVNGGWVIECKQGFFSGWQVVSQARSFQWEPGQPAIFSTKQEAAVEMAKLIARYG